MKPAMDWCKHPCASSHIIAHDRLSIGAGSIIEEFPVHMHTIKGIRCRADGHGVDVLQG